MRPFSDDLNFQQLPLKNCTMNSDYPRNLTRAVYSNIQVHNQVCSFSHLNKPSMSGQARTNLSLWFWHTEPFGGITVWALSHVLNLTKLSKYN